MATVQITFVSDLHETNKQNFQLTTAKPNVDSTLQSDPTANNI